MTDSTLDCEGMSYEQVQQVMKWHEAELKKREAAARVNGASDYVAETYGKRCEVKDYDDFPELKDDPLANRCLTCEEWDRFDRWAAQLHKEQPHEG